MKRRDDTLKVQLHEANANLAEAKTIIEQGRITREQRGLKQVGDWIVGSLYKTEWVSLRLWVVSSTTADPLPQLRFPCKAVYVGIEGRAVLHYEGGYIKLPPGALGSINPGEPHSLEPVEGETNVLQILVGCSDES